MKQLKKGPKRGVSAYSYTGQLGINMTMEDVFQEIEDLGATGIEILGNGHIENYPYPTDEWVDHWFAMCEKYNIQPAEYGHWVDSRLIKGHELTSEESLNMLVRDIKLAHRLGFRVLRTKLGVIDDTLTPVKNWSEFIKMALPYAEEYNVVMCPEIHIPTRLKSKMIDEYIEFIEKTNTKHFGLNIDFSIFQNRFDPNIPKMPGMPEDGSPCSYPEELKSVLPYVYCCHAKFNYVNENFEEETIPYKEVLQVLVDNNWDGYLISEYEGPHRDEPGFVSEQVRRQHIMMKKILGE